MKQITTRLEICNILTTPKDVRIERIKQLYPDNYTDRIKNMGHVSETDSIKLPDNTIYIDINHMT